MRRRTFLGNGAAVALAGCSQILGADDSEPTISAGDPRIVTRNNNTHAVIPLNHTANGRVFSGVSVDLSYLDGETVVKSQEYLVFCVPPSGLETWALSFGDSPADTVRVNGLSVVNPVRQIATDVQVSNATFGSTTESGKMAGSRNLSATFTNQTGSEIELYPYLVATYDGKAVLAANPGQDTFGVILGAGETLQHEAIIVHPNVSLTDGIEAYPCVSS